MELGGDQTQLERGLALAGTGLLDQPVGQHVLVGLQHGRGPAQDCRSLLGGAAGPVTLGLRRERDGPVDVGCRTLGDRRKLVAGGGETTSKVLPVVTQPPMYARPSQPA